MKDNQLKIIEAAKARGWDPSNLSPAQYRALAIAVRLPHQVVSDGAKALVSRSKAVLSINQVPIEKAAENKAVCAQNECGKFRTMVMVSRLKGQPPMQIPRHACDACNCASKWLDAKWSDASESCPITNPTTGQPYWSNRGA